MNSKQLTVNSRQWTYCDALMVFLTFTDNKEIKEISLIYACGLRRSEALNLKLTQVDSKRKLLLIKEGKGKKDKVVPLPENMIGILRTY